MGYGGAPGGLTPSGQNHRAGEAIGVIHTHSGRDTNQTPPMMLANSSRHTTQYRPTIQSLARSRRRPAKPA